MDSIIELFILPPMAVARLGSSETPLDAFRWAEEKAAHGATVTVVEPAVSLRVLPDSSIEPYLPRDVQFKDGEDCIRPVAPFLELWVRVQSAADGTVSERPLTHALLRELGSSLDRIAIRVTAGNRKAQARTRDAACSFVARAELHGTDHDRVELHAFSPHTSGQQVLVSPERPIHLGSFQVIRPVAGTVGLPSHQHPEVDRDVLRLRYTPPRGRVYGPPDATTGPASPVMPGVYDAPGSEYGRIHEIVPPEGRVLSPDTPWSRFQMMTGLWDDTMPWDAYDGANVGDNRSWGVVDDTCDVLVEVSLAVRGRRFDALGRVFVGPPDYAPDRRPIYSIADDLADRELPPVEVGLATFDETRHEMVDLFRRAFETASLLNVDASRARALAENALRRELKPQGDWPPPESEPQTGAGSMTAADTPYVDKIPALLMEQPKSIFSHSAAADRLPYTDIVPFVHAPMIDEDILLDFLRRRPDHVRRLIRPPMGHWSQLEAEPTRPVDASFRDPRVLRDILYDMRMPPYMRDANLYPLALSRRQYGELMSFLDLLECEPQGVSESLQARDPGEGTAS